MGRTHTVSIFGTKRFHFERPAREKVSTHFGPRFCKEMISSPTKTWTKVVFIFEPRFGSGFVFFGSRCCFWAVPGFVSLIKRFLVDPANAHNEAIKTYWNILNHSEAYYETLKHLKIYSTYRALLNSIKAYLNTVKHIIPYWSLWGPLGPYRNISKHIRTYWHILKRTETYEDRVNVSRSIKAY